MIIPKVRYLILSPAACLVAGLAMPLQAQVRDFLIKDTGSWDISASSAEPSPAVAVQNFNDSLVTLTSEGQYVTSPPNVTNKIQFRTTGTTRVGFKAGKDSKYSGFNVSLKITISTDHRKVDIVSTTVASGYPGAIPKFTVAKPEELGTKPWLTIGE